MRYDNLAVELNFFKTKTAWISQHDSTAFIDTYYKIPMHEIVDIVYPIEQHFPTFLGTLYTDPGLFDN
jgi:hypothetical protein